MVEKQRALQVEMQEKMAQRQEANMKKQQERMKRMQIATQVAIGREQFWWFAGFHSFLTLGLTGALIKKKPVHPAAVVPYLAFTLITAYQWDFAYGDKLERINNIYSDLQKEDHWYIPIDPEEKK